MLGIYFCYSHLVNDFSNEEYYFVFIVILLKRYDNFLKNHCLMKIIQGETSNDAFGKGMNLLIPPVINYIVPLLSLYKVGF